MVTGPTASVAVQAPYVTAAPAGEVASATCVGGAVIAGAIVSMTLTLNDPVALLPAASVAVQCTVVVPSGKTNPVAMSCDTVTETKSSVAVHSVKFTVAPADEVAWNAWSPGTVRTGGVVSAGCVETTLRTTRLSTWTPQT